MTNGAVTKYMQSVTVFSGISLQTVDLVKNSFVIIIHGIQITEIVNGVKLLEKNRIGNFTSLALKTF